ncbi:MAG: MurR/RpiR family transcriptional regulator [Spirochaetes bacterium]|nr:MAG: MurR/RpiR family transcriptional regulator [Spirochaetota bacterium]
MKKDFFVRIKTNYQSLSPSEKKVGDFVLKNAHEVMSMTMADLAASCGVSDATTLRFSRRLGYRGWLELKVALIRSLPETEEPKKKNAPRDFDYKDLFTEIIGKSKEALDDTLMVFNGSEMDAAVKTIRKARRILIVGSGTSGPVANDLYNRLFRLDLFCHIETDGLLQVMHASLLTPKDILFVISQSGEAESILRVAEVARKNGTPIITITGSRLSGLARLSDYLFLSVCHEANPETMTARIAQHAIVHAVYQSIEHSMKDISRVNEEKIWDAFFPETRLG